MKLIELFHKKSFIVITWKAVWLGLKPYLSCCGQQPCVLLIRATGYLSYVLFMVAWQLRYK
jgi:hypothetical protein